MASLTLVVQDREVRKFELNSTITTIGRAQDNDIVINNLALSRRHAEVHRRGSGYEVVDRGSQNGVFVNDERIDGPRFLKSSDVVTLGTYAFVFTPDPDVESERNRRRSSEAFEGEDPTPPPGQIEPVTPLPDLEPSAVPMAVLTYNELEIQRVPLEDRECLVGRAKECKIQIAERRLSRRHCLLYEEEGEWFIKDLGSQNGTYVNRRRVRDPRQLFHGDVLNFAEYSILFLSDAESYDAVVEPSVSPPPSARVHSSIEREQTEFPETYQAPSSALALVAANEPMVSPPRSKRLAEDGGVRVSSPSSPPRRSRSPESVQVRGIVDGAPSNASRYEEHDVPDPHSDIPRPDPQLNAWYAAREFESSDEEEPSVLLEHSKSTMSQVLSTMMVDRRELARNLEVARRARRFSVRVTWGSETLFDGVLERDVTILGADADSDVPLRGSYVAGRHSLLVRVRDSLLLVRLGSSSAARVNGMPRLQAFLKAGDVIQIDETEILVQEP